MEAKNVSTISFVQLEKTLKLKRVEFIENGTSVLFLGDYVTKFQGKITPKSKDACVDNMLAMMGMESCKPTSTPMVRKESAANGDEEMLEEKPDVQAPEVSGDSGGARGGRHPCF